MKTLMIYGASGYTGRMAAAHAKEAGLKLVLAGRDEAPLQALATRLGVECRVFALDSAVDVDYGLQDITVLLNCAGPYARLAGCTGPGRDHAKGRMVPVRIAPPGGP